MQGCPLMTDKVSACRFYVSMAKGKYHVSLDKVLGCMTESLLLAETGIGLHCDFKAKGSAAENSKIKAELKDEQAAAEGLWKFALAMYRWRAQSLAHYDMSFPGGFALLLSEKQTGVQVGLNLCKVAWRANSKAEEGALGHGAVRSLLDIAVFVDFLSVREVLVSLAEWDFSWVPPPERQSLETAFSGFGHSCIGEEAFNKIKDHQRDSNDLRISRVKRWMWPVQHQVLGDRYKRPEITGNARDVLGGAGRRLEATIFESQAVAPSIPGKDLKAITSRCT